jgi:glycine oxidase
LHNPSSSFDVAVVGGGAIGLAVAWRASQRGLRVVVLERDRPGAGTSRVAAGMLAPVAEASPIERRLLPLGLASAELYPGVVAELREVSGLDPGYLPCGTLLVARDRDEAEALEREFELRRSLGLEVKRVRPTAARELEPALAPTVRLGLVASGDHAVDPRTLTEALAVAVGRSGGEIRTGVAVRSVAGDGVKLEDGDEISAEQVVIAAGVWSDALGGIPEHARVPLHPVKGQIVRIHDPAGPGLLTRVLRMPGGYLVPRGDGRYVLGATMEERGFDTSVTAGALFELLRDASELVPGVSELVIDELAAGLRPATPDNLPAIGPAAVAGIHWAVGHYRHGILLAPITAELIAEVLVGSELPEWATPFAPARFGTRPRSGAPPEAPPFLVPPAASHPLEV